MARMGQYHITCDAMKPEAHGQPGWETVRRNLTSPRAIEADEQSEYCLNITNSRESGKNSGA